LDLSQQKSSLEGEKERMERMLVSKETKLQEFSKKEAELRDELEDLKEQLLEKDEELENMNEEIGLLVDTNRNMGERLAIVEELEQTSRSLAEEFEEKEAEWAEEVAGLKVKLQALGNVVAAKDVQLKSLASEKSNLFDLLQKYQPKSRNSSREKEPKKDKDKKGSKEIQLSRDKIINEMKTLFVEEDANLHLPKITFDETKPSNVKIKHEKTWSEELKSMPHEDLVKNSSIIRNDSLEMSHYALALDDYQATEVTELSFSTGEEIRVVDPTDADEVWFGFIKGDESRMGFFPSELVQIDSKKLRRVASGKVPFQRNKFQKLASFRHTLNQKKSDEKPSMRSRAASALGSHTDLRSSIKMYNQHENETNKQMAEEKEIASLELKYSIDLHSLSSPQLRVMYEKREKVALELKETEESYVSQLSIIIDQFITPLRAAISTNKPIIENSDLKNIFGGVEVIYRANQLLLSELRKRIAEWNDDQTLGDIFAEMTYVLKSYIPYISNYPQKLASLNDASSPTFSAFVTDSARQKACNFQTLDSLLILNCISHTEDT